MKAPFELTKEELDLIPSTTNEGCIARSVLIVPTGKPHEDTGYLSFTAIMFDHSDCPIWKTYEGQLDNYRIENVPNRDSKLGWIGNDFTNAGYLQIFAKGGLLEVKTDCSDTLVISIADAAVYKRCSPSMKKQLENEIGYAKARLENCQVKYNAIMSYEHAMENK